MVDLLRVVFLWATSAVVQAQVLDPAHSRVRLRDTFRDNLFIALLMARVPTIFALIANRVQKELVAERAEYDLVELSLHEFVAVHLVNFILPLANRTLSSQSARRVERPLSHVLLDCGRSAIERRSSHDTYRS